MGKHADPPCGQTLYQVNIHRERLALGQSCEGMAASVKVFGEYQGTGPELLTGSSLAHTTPGGDRAPLNETDFSDPDSL